MLKKILPVICSFIFVVVSVLVFLNGYTPNFNQLQRELTEQEKQALQRNTRAVNIYYAAAEEKSNAEEYGVEYKGGTLYLEPGAKFTMNGGEIVSQKSKFGGGVYVSAGATFTMNGGKITGCEAEYGGAIYVEAKGILNIKGDCEITENQATYAPAIYLEAGASINIEETVTINRNFVVYENGLKISTEKLYAGNPKVGVRFNYAEFGTYPQTFVGTEMNQTLETWYTANQASLTAINTYTSGVPSDWGTTTTTYYYREWKSYLYTDGNVYARGLSLVDVDSLNFTYLDGTTVIATDCVVWFKVEPIKWLVLNYKEYMSSEEAELELMSYLALNSQIPFYPNVTDEDCNAWYKSYLRGWLNDNFYDTAFSSENKILISLSTIKNNVTGNYETESSDGTGVETEDYIYCKSYYEMISEFSNDSARLCSSTDFCLSNNAKISVSQTFQTQERPEGGTCRYWVRSAATSATYALYVYSYGAFGKGVLGDGYDVNYSACAVRPVLKLSV